MVGDFVGGELSAPGDAEVHFHGRVLRWGGVSVGIIAYGRTWNLVDIWGTVLFLGLFGVVGDGRRPVDDALVNGSERGLRPHYGQAGIRASREAGTLQARCP